MEIDSNLYFIYLFFTQVKSHCRGFMILVFTATLLFNVALTLTLLEERFW